MCACVGVGVGDSEYLCQCTLVISVSVMEEEVKSSLTGILYTIQKPPVTQTFDQLHALLEIGEFTSPFNVNTYTSAFTALLFLSTEIFIP